MIKNKKGVSPVVATVVLIVIAIVIAIIIFTWAMYYLGEKQLKLGKSIKQSCDDVNLEVEKNTDGELSISNNGDVAVYKVQVMIEENEEDKVSGGEVDVNLSPGMSKTIDGYETALSVVPILQDDEGQKYTCKQEFEVE